jgi:hypothetical protein
MNIGGKPNFSLLENLPAFIPITFEMTVFCAAHGMAVTYMLRNGIYPGKKNWNPDIRTTDDKFLMLIDMEENHSVSAEEIKSILKENGVEEISEK